MKKIVSIILVSVLAIALGLGILAIIEQRVEAVAERGHLVWDPVDEVVYCLGTPTNCAFKK